MVASHIAAIWTAAEHERAGGENKGRVDGQVGRRSHRVLRRVLPAANAGRTIIIIHISLYSNMFTYVLALI